MSQDDDTPRWAAGFKDAVKGLMGAPDTWGPTYTDEAAFAQALKVTFPTGESVEERFETVEEAWERLGLFEPPERLPEPWVVTLEPLDGDHYVWCVRSVRSVLGLSLADAEDYVKELLDD